MPEKIKVWHSGEWVCALVNDGVSKSTISLTRLEAADLRQKLVPPDLLMDVGIKGDGGECERLHGISAGHVLTEEEAKDIDNIMADFNELLGSSALSFHEGRLHALREIGGDALVAAADSVDEAMADRAVAQAMKLFEKRRREIDDGEPRPR